MVMCNEKSTTDKIEEQRFLDYRINQLEHNLAKSIEKLEKEQKESNNEIMSTLQLMQQGLNDNTKTLIELTQRQHIIEEKIKCIDRLKEVATKHSEEIKTLKDRLDVYKQILLIVGTGVGVALLIDFIKFI